MLSRVAENLYWMTRYMERAEKGVRWRGVRGSAEREEDGDAFHFVPM